MREALVLLLGILLLSAGCLTGDPGTDDGDEAPGQHGGSDASQPRLPFPIRDSGHVQMAVDPLSDPTGPPCQGEASKCFSYPVSLPAPAVLEAILSWENVTSNFDLYVYPANGDQPVAKASGAPPGTNETLETELAPGAYNIVVVAWLVPEDTYTLEASFDRP